MAPEPTQHEGLGVESAALDVAAALRRRGETVAVCETAAGGLISAALLGLPGASAFFIGGAVAYSRASRHGLLDLHAEDVQGLTPMSKEMGAVFAERTRTRLGADWGLAELGIAGPGPSPYGGPSGVALLAVTGPVCIARLLETGHDDRGVNMQAFAAAALMLLAEAVAQA